jgi:hypothetical protein
MATRRNRNSRKSRRGGLFGIKAFKTWGDNKANCYKRFKGPSGYDGNKLREYCEYDKHKSRNWHSDGTNSAWHGDEPKF